MKQTFSKGDLIKLEKKHDVLLAIDSDGCVFDSMTVKQQLFHTGIIEFWGMEAVASGVRKRCEWVGLYSPWRGLNRFQLLLRIFQALEQGISNPGNSFPTKALAAFVESGETLSMPELEKWMEEKGAPELQTVLDWSREMSRRVAELPTIPLVDGVFYWLENLHAQADLIVVSQTTEDALVREWESADIAPFVDVIAGAELGSKQESLETAMKGRYDPEQTLMIGDALGDLDAARAAGCLFFPILPGEEANSWNELGAEGMERLRNARFAGAYQNDLIARFNAALSPEPPESL